ncbi:MAG: putative toxin-antitoxin system toxin component, PIN family [Cytophagaceae bacterium]|nr:MAG: putative toxin-antitoxin system toxin component, PIN family [Cytophagaceae bacterium]
MRLPNATNSKKYISREDTALFLEIVRLRLTIITPTTVITDCTDPDDNYLLALAIDAKADYLITGDKADLLVMSPYRGVPIVRLQTVLDILANP